MKGLRAELGRAVAMVLGVCAFYWGSLDNPFHYDDFHSLVENPHIRTLENIPAFFTRPELFSSDPKSAMYRPAVLLSYAFNHALGGYEVRGYHLFNLLVHAANGLLVLALVRVLGGERDTALLAGLLFALHPVNSEAVNYISSRSESLCALFVLGSFLGYVRAGQGVDGWRALSLLAFALALLTKAVGIVLPALLVLYEATLVGEVRQRVRQVAARLLPYGALALAYMLFTRGLVGEALVRHPVRDMGTQLLTQTKALAYYAKLLCMPWGLSVEHQFALAHSPLAGAFLLALALGLGAAAALWRLRGRWPALLFWVGWAFVALLPTLVVPLNVLVNEHRLYLPCVAFAACAARALVWLGRRQGAFGALLAVVWLGLYGCLDYQRTGVWESGERLWIDALEKAPHMPRPHLYAGDVLKDRGEVEKALEHYRRALEVHPQVLSGSDVLVIYNNMGAAYLAQGRFAEAAQSYQKALAIDSTYTRSRESLEGLQALMGEGKNPVAKKLYKQGLALVVAGQFDPAIEALKASLALENAVQTWMALALAYERKEDWPAALETYRILRSLSRGSSYAQTAAEKIRAIQERR